MGTPRPSSSGLDLAQLTKDLLPAQAGTFRRLLEAQASAPNREDRACILLRRAGLSDADATRAIRNARRLGSS